MAAHSTPIQASFLKSALRIWDCPDDDIAEVAFVGRSNAGKSSAINCLTGTKGLARVSKTPGRTQLINFYETSEQGRIVDLPGFGYAKASRDAQLKWREAVNDYLEGRENLRGIVLVMDSRHPLQPFDVDMIEWVLVQELNLLALLNKSDKLKQGERSACLRKVSAAIADNDYVEALMFSALKGTGSAEARSRIRSMWSESGLDGNQ